jgi:hypothetical protein
LSSESILAEGATGAIAGERRRIGQSGDTGLTLLSPAEGDPAGSAGNRISPHLDGTDCGPSVGNPQARFDGFFFKRQHGLLFPMKKAADAAI